MNVRGFRFDRVELAGSLGDLGVMLPLLVGMISIGGLDATTSLVCVGAFYIAAGLYYRVPIPVQPLKLVAALAIAAPSKYGVEHIAAMGIIFGVLLPVIAWTGILDALARLFTKPVVRGIQAGIGLLLAVQGVQFIVDKNMFIGEGGAVSMGGVAINPVVGVIGAFVALVLISSKRIPAALAIVAGGILIGLIFSGDRLATAAFGPTMPRMYFPSASVFLAAFVYLVLPQLPLTLGNSIIGLNDAACALYGEKGGGRASNRAFATGIGAANLITGFLGGMPMCHGAGGLAAHYRFGARTGGANLMIGAIFIALGLLFGKAAPIALAIIPNGILGTLLLFAGIEMAMLMRDVRESGEMFVAFLIVGASVATKNMAIAFVAGMIADYFIRRGIIKI